MSPSPKYNIPEHTTPKAGLISPEGGRFHFGDYMDSSGFEFPENKVIPHRHPYYEIFWLPESSGAFLADFRTFQLSGPCLVFISPGQVHGWPGGHTLRGYLMAFDDAFLEESDKALLRSPLFYNAETSPVLPVIETADMTTLWKRIQAEFEHQPSDHLAAVQSWLRLLLISAHRMAILGTQDDTIVHSASARIYQSFIKLLSAGLPEKRLPKHYAERLGVSPDYLSECVRNSCGHSAGDLIHQRVTLESKRLLAHSDLSISEIAYYLHFKDPSYFSRFFKRNTSQLPKEFRENAHASS